MPETTERKEPQYSYLGLTPSLEGAARQSLRAPMSRILDMDTEVRPTHISHLAIATNNFDAVASWWQTVLLAKPSLATDGMRFMTFDSEHHKVAVFDVPHLERRQGSAQQFCGMHHIAFTYGSFADLASTYLRLKKAGIEPFRGLNHGTSFALDYYDPDYNMCELQCSCFPLPEGEKHHLNEWLATGAFNRNPIGVLFDMEEAIRAYEQGVGAASIVTPRALKVGEHTQDELRAGRMLPLGETNGGQAQNQPEQGD